MIGRTAAALRRYQAVRCSFAPHGSASPACKSSRWIARAMRSISASVSVVVIGSTSRRRVPGDGLGRQRYGRAPCLCSALPSPPGTCGKPPGSLLLLVSSGGTGGHHRLSASPDRAGKPFAVLRLLPERRGDGIQDRDALGVGRLLGGEVGTRPLGTGHEVVRVVV